jgi:hypothetical protein
MIVDGRCGVVVGILAYYARGRGFDSRTVQTFVYIETPRPNTNWSSV